MIEAGKRTLYIRAMTVALSKADIAKLVNSTAEFCAKEGLRFTDSRQHVLEIIAGSKKPMGAYDILEALKKYMDDPKPPTAYRAIEFLREQGLVHRIESLNAYVLCDTDHRHAGSQFMVCDSCGTVIEAHLCELPQDLESHVKKQGFHLKKWDAELHGTCRNCTIDS